MKSAKYGFIAALATIFSGIPLLRPGFFQAHDSFFHLDRLVLLDHALRQGCLHPRWIQELAHGYGMPLFNYYPPFSYYFAELFHLLGLGFPEAIRATFIAGFVLSALAMFLFARELLGEAPAVAAAAAYVYAPYHLLDAYVRGAMPEFLAFVPLPLIFYSTVKAEEKRHHYPLISLSYALLILTHNVMAVISTPFIILFMLIQGDRKKSLLFLLLGLGLSSFYIVPALSELGYIHPITTYRYTDHFLYPFQLFQEKWDFGLSLPGPNDEMGFHIGNIHILFSILALYILRKNGDGELKKYAKYFGAVSLLSAFFSLQASEPLTRFIPFFRFVQFPWRFLFISAFAVSFLSATFVKVFERTRDQRLVAAALAILFIIYAVPMLQVIPASEKTLALHTYDAIKQRGPKTVVGAYEKEWLPVWVHDYSQIRAGDKIPWPPGTVQTGCNSYRIEGMFSETTEITLPIFYFPGWRVEVNGGQAPLTPSEEGFMTFTVPQGPGRIEIAFEDTAPRRAGWMISLFSAILLAGYSLTAEPLRL